MRPQLRLASCLSLAIALGACSNERVSLGDDSLTVADAGQQPRSDAGNPPSPDAGRPPGRHDASPQPPQDAATPDAGLLLDGGAAPTGATCSRRLHPPCPEEQFCQFEARDECGAGDRTGTCQPYPEGCEGGFDPVCGCDNQTYENECEALSRGISVHYNSDCARAPGEELPCSARSGCPPGLYCEHGNAGCDAPGVCRPAEQACPRDFRPVCGCDGQSYTNSCWARAIGTDIDYPGPCNAPGDAGVGSCGGSENTQCPDGQLCDLSMGDGCDVPDARGTCRPAPRSQDQCPFFFAPVCGCDDVTYGNVCLADVAGVSVRYFAECM